MLEKNSGAVVTVFVAIHYNGVGPGSINIGINYNHPTVNRHKLFSIVRSSISTGYKIRAYFISTALCDKDSFQIVIQYSVFIDSICHVQLCILFLTW